MIDEKKLIKNLEKEREKLVDYSEEIDVLLEYVTRFIDEQPKIGGWIPCSERLPEEKTNPATNDFYEYQVTFRIEKVTDVRHYKFGRGHWWNCGQNMDKYVVAWQPLPDVYKERD